MGCLIRPEPRFGNGARKREHVDAADGSQPHRAWRAVHLLAPRWLLQGAPACFGPRLQGSWSAVQSRHRQHLCMPSAVTLQRLHASLQPGMGPGCRQEGPATSCLGANAGAQSAYGADSSLHAVENSCMECHCSCAQLAVAYAVLEFQGQSAGACLDSHTWDLASPSEPDATLSPASALVCLCYNLKDPKVSPHACMLSLCTEPARQPYQVQSLHATKASRTCM